MGAAVMVTTPITGLTTREGVTNVGNSTEAIIVKVGRTISITKVGTLVVASRATVRINR